MKNVIMIHLFVFVVFSNLFSQEPRILEDATVITNEMVSTTNIPEAMEAYNIGTNLLKQNNYKEAEEYFLKAIELDIKFVDAMDHLGIVYRNLNRYEDAEIWYLRSIEMNSNNLTPYINLGIVYRLQGRIEDARQIYLRAQKIDPSDPEPYFGIGVLYQLVGQYSISIDFIKIAIGIYSERKSVLLLCGAMYVQGNNYYYLEEYEEALKYYKVALLGYPDNNEIQNKIIEIEENLK